MSKRSGTTTAGSEAPQSSKPPGSKSIAIQRSVRPSSPAQTAGSRRNIKTTPSRRSLHSDDDNNSAPNSPLTSARDSEPATDDESHFAANFSAVSESAGYEANFQLDAAERQAVAMLNKITKKSERNHRKYDAFRDNISGKDKRIDELHASFQNLACQTANLEVLCNGNVDADSLEKLFMTIPLQQRKLYIGE